MSYGRTDDRAPFKAKVRDASWACRGVIFSAALPWCSGGETDGILAPAFVRDCIYGRDGKRGFREAIERGFIHLAGELCDRCIAELRKARTAPPTAGYYLHDYLKHNPSKREIEKRREDAARRQANHRGRRNQAHLGFDDPPLSHPPSRVTNPPLTPRRGEGTTGSSSGDQPDLDARIGAVMARLASCCRFELNEIDDPVRIANLLVRHPEIDMLAAAEKAALWGGAVTWAIDDAVTTLAIAAEKQVEKRSAGRSKAQRERDDIEALRRLAGGAG